MYAWDQFFALTVAWLALVSPALTSGRSNASQIPAVMVSQKVYELPSFTSVESRNDARVTVRQGPSQRVTLLNGDPACIRITVETRSRLIIDKVKCATRSQPEVEVTVSTIDALAVSNGGWLQSLGNFTQQRELAVAVNQGGILDIRSMAVQNVTAAVNSGGRILTKPQSTLVASISDGGAITYWGAAKVTSAVTHGGAVTKGDPADADKPVKDSGYSIPPVPAVPPVRTISSVP